MCLFPKDLFGDKLFFHAFRCIFFSYLQFIAAFPENSSVFLDFVGSLSFHLLRDGVDVVSSIFLVKANELVEISFAPVGKTL